MFNCFFYVFMNFFRFFFFFQAEDGIRDRNVTGVQTCALPICPVPADVAGDFAPARRVTNVDRILQIQRFDERREVVSVRVHVVAVPRLAGAAMPAPVMGNAAVASRGQEEHLVFEGICAERPTVAEDDWLSRSPVVEVDLRAIPGGDRAHRMGLPATVTARLSLSMRRRRERLRSTRNAWGRVQGTIPSVHCASVRLQPPPSAL